MSYLIQDVFADGANVAKDKIRQALVGNVEKMAHLKALAAPNHDGTPIFLRGYFSANDGGGGMFIWSATSTATGDDGLVVVPSGALTNGRWHRVFEGAINVKWFGAVGDGTTDDTPALQKALTAAAAFAGEVWAPAGVYRHLTLNVTGPLTLRGAGERATIFRRLTNNAESFHVDYVANDSSGLNQRVVFEKFQIDGNSSVNSGGDGILFADGAGYSTCFVGRNLTLINSPARGLHAGTGRNAGVLDGVSILNSISHGLSIAGSEWTVSRCLFSGTTLTGATVYLSGSANTFTQCTLALGNFANLQVTATGGTNTFLGCTFHDSPKHGAYLEGQGLGTDLPIRFVGCAFYGNSSSATNTFDDLYVTNRGAVGVNGCTFTWPGVPAAQPKYTIEFTLASAPGSWTGNTIAAGANASGVTNFEGNLIASSQSTYNYSGKDVIIETAAPVDERRWVTRVSGSTMVCGTTNDAESLTVPWLTVSRAGNAAEYAQIIPPLRIGNFSASSLPSPAVGPGTLIFVFDASPSPCVAFSDGTHWKRVYDNTNL